MRADIIERIQQMRLRVLRIVRGVRTGDHFVPQQSATGMEFDALREYQQGDDVRRIDWSSSVRSNTIMVRTYREEENRSIVLLLDLTESSHLGSTAELKDEAMQTIALMLGCAADLCHDAVGVIVINKGAVSGIPPQKGRAHMMRCAEHILAASGEGAAPPLQEILGAIGQFVPRQSCVFFISDGLLADYAKIVQVLIGRATCGMIRVRDQYEGAAGGAEGFLLHNAYAPSPSASSMVDATVVQQYARAWYTQQACLLESLGVRMLELTAGRPYDYALKLFLEQGV